MKYSKNSPPLVCMQTTSTCYQGTRTMDVKGVLWHSTGANNPTLKRYVQPSDNAPDKAKMLQLLGVNNNKNDWNHIKRDAGLNCWIGKLADGTVTTVQTMPWNYRPWGCGSGPKGSCNSGWVQFEICEDSLTDKTYFDTCYKEACEITAYICSLYNIDPKGTVMYNGVKVPTILCHWDSYKLGLGGGHSDVYHWFNKYGKTMDDVRNDVAALLNQKEDEVDMTKAEVIQLIKSEISAARVVYATINDVPVFYRPSVQKLIDKKWLQGTGGGKLNVTEDLCRMITILDRTGAFDK